jgi:hypothetical protein
MSKPNKMRLTEHVARTGIRRTHIRYWLESKKEGDHLEDLDVGWRIILKWILER